MATGNVKRDLVKEATGWMQIIFLMLLFPALFFLCVWIPIWFDWAKVW